MIVKLHWKPIPGGFKSDGKLMLGKWMIGKHYREGSRAVLGQCRAICHLPGRKRNTVVPTVQRAEEWVENHTRKWFESSSIDCELEFVKEREEQ